MWKKVISLLMLTATMSAHRISQLQVPLYADPRRAAELTCHFDMAGQKLHSLKWYRDMSEIFRYNPSQTPSIRLFNVSGVMVQSGECQAESCTLHVMPAPLSTRATFTCEVSTEGPKFKIARESKQMTVVAIPSSDPVISGTPDTVKAGEQHLLNCTSDLSLPPAEIRWYIDDELQKVEPWQHTEQGDPQTGGVKSSWRTLRLVVPPLDSGALRVRCEAVLDVEPPVVKHAEESIPIVSRTQLSKFVASGGLVWSHEGGDLTLRAMLIIHHTYVYQVCYMLDGVTPYEVSAYELGPTEYDDSATTTDDWDVGVDCEDFVM